MPRLVLAAILAALSTGPAWCQSDLYLIGIVGQSNASGRGLIRELPANFPAHPNAIWNFTNADKWQHPAQEPIDSKRHSADRVSRDREAGVGPALAIADAFVAAHPGVSVGLIPCAKGASKIEQWLPASNHQDRDTLYGSCMHRMKQVAPANGTIRAILFWQGASDAENEDDAKEWGNRFRVWVDAVRADLGYSVPIIMVVLPENTSNADDYPYWDMVRAHQMAVTGFNIFKVHDIFEKQPDGEHETTAGYLAAGAAIARLLPAP